MKTSEQGKAALKAEEGVVLKAYRNRGDVWTIGAGLTAASGVIKPKAGMVITEEQHEALLDRALSKYEKGVLNAMVSTPGSAVILPKQNELDAGVLFHWNTGAIARASWVKRWKQKAAAATIRAAMALWNKGGGRVLPGLVARRQREADILLLGVYPKAAKSTVVQPAAATWVLQMSGAEIAAARAGFQTLGYDAGPFPNAVLRQSVLQFQRDHDLTVDGIIGRATLSTLQRRLDARKKIAAPVASGATTAAAPALMNDPARLSWLFTAFWVGLCMYALWLTWRYRDVIAAKISNHLPRVAAVLRSF
jgi:lysozyme